MLQLSLLLLSALASLPSTGDTFFTSITGYDGDYLHLSFVAVRSISLQRVYLIRGVKENGAAAG